MARVSDVAIVGAHTALGEAVKEALETRGLGAACLTTTENIGPDLALITPEAMQKAKLLLVCADEPLIQGLAGGVSQLNAQWLDAATVLSDAPLWIPFVNEEAPKGPARLPLGPTWPIVATLHPLLQLGLVGASIVTVEGVSGLGKPGLEALSAQIRAVFTGTEPPTEVLGAPVAFNLLPHGLEEGDAQLAEDVEVFCEIELSVRRTTAALFGGEAMLLDLQFAKKVEAEQVAQALSQAPMVRPHPRAPRSLEAQGRTDVLVSPPSVRGQRVQLSAAYDRLMAGTAVVAAVAAEKLGS